MVVSIASSTCFHFVGIGIKTTHPELRRLGIFDTDTRILVATCDHTHTTHFRLSLSRLLLSSLRRIEPGTFRECIAISVPPSYETPATKETSNMTRNEQKKAGTHVRVFKSREPRTFWQTPYSFKAMHFVKR